VAVGTEAEVLDGLAAVLGATEDQGVAASGGTESELIEGDGLTTGSDDASTGGGSEAESGDGGLREGQESVVVGDGANNDDDALLLLLADVADDAGQRHGRTVDLGHEQALEHDLVEGRLGTAGQEAVKLDQELQVDIVALGGLAVSALDVVAVEIDTYRVKSSSAGNSGMLKKVPVRLSNLATREVETGHLGRRKQRDTRSRLSSHSHTKAALKMLSRTHGGGRRSSCRC
jgi:hypothetical protein